MSPHDCLHRRGTRGITSARALVASGGRGIATARALVASGGRGIAAARALVASGVVALALTAADAGAGVARSADPGAPRSAAAAVGTPDGLLTWISRHRSNAGVAVLPDRGPAAISFGAGRRYPLGSTRKILIAGALTASARDLSQRVPRSEVERFYVPGTDGGAHEHAQLDPTRPTLRQLLRAAIEVSDNASADALLDRIGAGAVDAWARRQGMARQDPIFPVLGEFAAWTRDSAWTQRSPSGRARIALALARAVPAAQIHLPEIAAQRRLAASSVAGAPAEWAQLMRRIGRDGDRELVAALDWPRRQTEQSAHEFDRFLTKGGNLAGVITEASYVRPAGRAGTAVALFLRDLPPDVEQVLRETFAHQQLIVRLATDPAFLAHARQVLGSR